MRNGFAGEALNLTPDLVIYMGREAQNGRTDPRVLTEEDARIADGIAGALVRTMEYRPDRDGPATLEPITPPGYQPGSGDVEELLAGGQSFDLSYPKIPGRDLEGIPNANDPVMREKLRQRLLKNPGGGQELPGFLKKA